MKKAIENLMPKAYDAVSEHLEKNGKVPSEYNGYIASLGSSIQQMGLLPAMAVFADLDSAKAAEPQHLINAIQYVLNSSKDGDNKWLIKDLINLKSRKNNVELKRYRKKITNASVAIKLAIRLFKTI